MDFVNKLTHNNQPAAGHNPAMGGSAMPGTHAPAAGAQRQDYGDKAFDMMAKKAGHPVDRNTGEKITDAARGVFEKATGKKVDPKYSN